MAPEILLEQDEEWAVTERRYSARSRSRQLTAPALLATAQDRRECVKDERITPLTGHY